MVPFVSKAYQGASSDFQTSGGIPTGTLEILPPITTDKIADAKLRASKLTGAPYSSGEGVGLSVEVTPNVSKSWPGTANQARR